MNAPAPRARHFARAGRKRAFADGLLGGLIDKAGHRILDRVDAGLEQGAIEAKLPDGTLRILGGRAPGPLVDVTLTSWNALLRLVRAGSAGWYRAWAAGEWTSPDPVPLFELFMLNRVPLGSTARAKGVSRLVKRLGHALRRNTPMGARHNIELHYDLGNEFYAAWLDTGMNYSSARYDRSRVLEDAQRDKIDRLLDRLDLQRGDRLLEIGCGWGPVLEAAAARGAHATGITLSQRQAEYAAARVPEADVRLQDYRDAEGRFDAIASVEMVEAVGREYWPAFLDTIVRCLKPGGKAALQFILIADDIFERYAESVDFIQAYIFPGGSLLSASRFRALAERRGLQWRHEDRFGCDYAETLKDWRSRFDGAVEQGMLPPGFDRKFVDLWRYYLMYCEGGFRGGGIDVAQVTLVKGDGA